MAGTRLLVISGPSGAGKTSLAQALVRDRPGLELSVSYTSRAPRAGEVDGVDYHFVDAARFDAMAASGQFLEHARVFDHRYGTGRMPVERALAAGRHVVLEIDWQGAAQVRRAWPDCASVMVLPPSLAALEARLKARGEPAATIARRMRDAVAELSHWRAFDYLVVNDDFACTLADLGAVVRALELARPAREEWLRAHLPEAWAAAPLAGT